MSENPIFFRKSFDTKNGSLEFIGSREDRLTQLDQHDLPYIFATNIRSFDSVEARGLRLSAHDK